MIIVRFPLLGFQVEQMHIYHMISCTLDCFGFLSNPISNNQLIKDLIKTRYQTHTKASTTEVVKESKHALAANGLA